MSTATAEAVVLRSPGECIANIPAMIGFTPNNSAVVIWLKGGSVLVTQRADLKPALVDPQEFVGPMRKHNPDEAIIVFWDSGDSSSDDMDSFITTINDVATIRDAMWVKGDRWGSVICEDPDCCPADGTPIDPFLKARELPEPTASRDDLLVECKPVGTERMKPLDPHGIDGWRDKQIDRLLDVWAGDGFESPKHLIRAGRALHDIRVRDTILWYAASLDDGELRRAYDLASCVARAMHPDDAAPACTAAAIIAWMMGDGARANVANEYGLKSNPDYSLGTLIEHALRSGMPPSAWRDAMSSLTLSDVRNGK